MVQIEGGALLDFPLNSPGSPRVFAGQEAWLRELVNCSLRRNWEDIDKLLEAIRLSQSADEGFRSSTLASLCLMFGAKPLVEFSAPLFDGTNSCLKALCAEIDRWPALRTVAACSGRTLILSALHDDVSANATGASQWRESTSIVKDASYFDVSGLAQPDDMGLGGPRQSYWFRLEPFSLKVWCRDLNAASALIAVVGTASKKPGLTLHEGRCLVEIFGADRLEVPLLTPDGSHPYAGEEEWLRELANTDLLKNWAKIEGLLADIKALPADAASAAWGDLPPAEMAGP